MHTRNYEAIGEALLGSPGKDFTPMGEPEEHRFNDVRLLATVQNFTRPIRRVGPGAVLVGVERRLAFVGGLPNNVFMAPHVLSAQFEPAYHAAGLVFDAQFFRLDSKLSGWPAPGEPLSGFIWSREAVAPEASWPAVVWAFGLGFSVEELGTFASAPGCLDVLREGAHGHLVQHFGMIHPRERLSVFRRAAAVLPGFSKADAAGAYAEALFHEALLEACAAADVPGLLALVAALAGEEGDALPRS